MKLLDKLEALEKEATPGKWLRDDFELILDKSDIDYIAALRNAATALLAVAKAAEHLLHGEPAVTKFERLRDALQSLKALGDG